MVITPIKTRPVTKKEDSLFGFLDEFVGSFEDKSILVITSKIVSIMQGRVVEKRDAEKRELVVEESELYLEPEVSKFNFSITIKNGLLVPAAGIDESNADGKYILWPENPQEVANSVREYLCKRFSTQYAGVIITDSTTRPLRWGTTGVSIAYSGFSPLNDYIGTKDIFGRTMEVTKANIMDALAASAVVTMGEGAEVTPLAIISDIPFVQFQDRNPTEDELRSLTISLEEDLYEPLLKTAPWKKGHMKKDSDVPVEKEDLS